MTLREELAKLEHIQWQSWAQKKDISHPLAYVEYERLVESEKGKDRQWADRVLALVREQVEEIRKENPYPKSIRAKTNNPNIVQNDIRYLVWEASCQKMLKMLKKGERNG